MAQELDTKNLAIVPKDQIVHKSDNDAFVKKILDILIAKDKKHDQKIEALSQAFQQLMANLRNEVNGLFVSDRVKKIEDTHNERVKAIDEKLTKADRRISELKDGYTPIKGKDYFDGVNGIDGQRIKPVEIKNKLESLEGEERLDASAIKGLEDVIGDVKVLKGRNVGLSANTGRDLIMDIDITDQLDGVTKTFQLGAFYNILSVSLSSYPYGSPRKGVDYTYDANLGTITFEDTIDETSQLKSDQKCVITIIRA